MRSLDRLTQQLLCISGTKYFSLNLVGQYVDSFH